MTVIKDISTYVKAHHIIAFLGAIVLVIALYQYSSGKSTIMDKMSGLQYGEKSFSLVSKGEKYQKEFGKDCLGPTKFLQGGDKSKREAFQMSRSFGRTTTWR